MKNLHTIFPSGCIDLHSHQQFTRVPFSPYPCQHLLSLIFLIKAILTGIMWYLFVVLICIPQWLVMLSNFSCTHYISYLKKCLFMSFVHFKIWLFVFLLLKHITRFFRYRKSGWCTMIYLTIWYFFINL